MGSGSTGGVLRGATPYNTLNRNGPDACPLCRLRSRLHKLLHGEASQQQRLCSQRTPPPTDAAGCDRRRHRRPDLPCWVCLPGTHRPPLICYNTLSSTNHTDDLRSDHRCSPQRLSGTVRYL